MSYRHVSVTQVGGMQVSHCIVAWVDKQTSWPGMVSHDFITRCGQSKMRIDTCTNSQTFNVQEFFLWQAPVGFWDPAGFTADGSTENFARRRQTELKHGRISMLDAWSTFGKTLHLCEIVGSRRYEHLNFEHVYSGKYVCD